MIRDVTIRQRREVTISGETQVREIYAQGHTDREGYFHLERCIGMYGPKKQPKKVTSAAPNRAA
jgi:hypothetical protein